ncbi:MAG: Esterase [Actinomycetia bacterium]|nr:Esterase [Actinomycetes bacterium]
MLLAGATAANASSTWPVYHANAARTGNATGEPSVLPLHRRWTASLDNSVYGQPTVFAGRVFAATENNTVYSLDANDGHVLWARHLGPPVNPVAPQVGCGNISPLGITSTPVIDTATHTIFVLAAIQDGFKQIHHQLVGIDAITGARRVSVNADPGAPQDPLYIQQRAALALGNGRVYIGYGGHAGDCGPYHGWLVSIAENGGGKVAFNVTPHTGEGAIWATSGPAIDSTGNVYVSTGNPDPNAANHDYGESVLKFDPTLHLLANLSTFPGGDRDLGSVGPALLPNNLLFQVGKQQVGFLIDRASLSTVQQLAVCRGEAFGGTAFDGSRLFVPCTEHIQAVNINAAGRSMSLGWTGPATANAGPPIVAGGVLWSVDWPSGKLYGLNPATGATLATAEIGRVPHFASPTAALGLLLIGTNGGVAAFDGPAGPPPHPPSTCVRPSVHTGYTIVGSDGNVFPSGGAPNCGSLFGVHLRSPVVGVDTPVGARGYWMVASDGGVFAFGDARFHGSTGGIHLNAPVVGMARTPSGKGYWLVASDGGVFAFGDARFHGSTGAIHLNAPVVGMARTPSGMGYWLVASDGGVFAFGDARFHGSTGAIHLNAPVVGMARTPSGKGYWLVASDGGVFAFGDARFRGSTGAIHLNAPVVGISRTASGNGYWLVATDGGIFAFGDARFHGSTGAIRLAAPVVGMAATPSGSGYWLMASDGGVFAFAAPFRGSAVGFTSGAAAVAIVHD